jgi:hypothetical protein
VPESLARQCNAVIPSEDTIFARKDQNSLSQFLRRTFEKLGFEGMNFTTFQQALEAILSNEERKYSIERDDLLRR